MGPMGMGISSTPVVFSIAMIFQIHLRFVCSVAMIAGGYGLMTIPQQLGI